MLLLGVIMKKIIITVFIALLLTVSCIYDPNALSYNEIRHSQLIDGRYICQRGSLTYELIISSGNENAVLNIYIKDPLKPDNEPEKLIATLNGYYEHVEYYRDRYYDHDYDRPYYSYHIDNLVFRTSDNPNHSKEKYSGKVIVYLDSEYTNDKEDYYDNNWNLKIKEGTKIILVPLTDEYYPEIDRDRELPRKMWEYLGLN